MFNLDVDELKKVYLIWSRFGFSSERFVILKNNKSESVISIWTVRSIGFKAELAVPIYGFNKSKSKSFEFQFWTIIRTTPTILISVMLLPCLIRWPIQTESWSSLKLWSNKKEIGLILGIDDAYFWSEEKNNLVLVLVNKEIKEM